MTVKFITLGCKTNSYESEAMAQLFEDSGYKVISKGVADIYIINTCTVTGTGASKSIKMIHKARKENPNATIAVTGCLSQTEPDRIIKENADVIIGNKHRSKIVFLCEEAEKGKKICKVEDILKVKDYEELGIVHRQRRIRAEIKIEDGCNNFCSYCKIPYARGPVRSRNIDKIIEEATTLINDGYIELVLTGIHIGSYGKDLKTNISLIDVIEKVCSIPGDFRLRLGSLEPIVVTKNFTERASTLSKLCPQFHMSLQSGCDKTLKTMRRNYTTTEFKNAVLNLRQAFKDAAITTDLIVGFPGETIEDFEESKNFCEEIGFSQMHIFPYSVREGTAAAKLDNKVTEEEKSRRSHIMLGVAKNLKSRFYQGFIGKSFPVLFEQQKDGLWCGFTENYMDVRLKCSSNLKGKIKEVVLYEYNEKGQYVLAIEK